MKLLKYFFVISSALILFSNSYAAEQTNFNCPDPSQIIPFQVYPDPMDVSFWFAPAVAGSDGMGSGLGGSKVGSLIGASPATVNDKPGWICYYGSKHADVSEFQKRENQLPVTTRGLINQLGVKGINVGMVAYQHQ